MNISDTDDLTDKTHGDEVFRHFSKALLATLYRVYADDLENWTNENEFRKTASYFHFFKKVISNDPEL
jgi:hypothetical protein